MENNRDFLIDFKPVRIKFILHFTTGFTVDYAKSMIEHYCESKGYNLAEFRVEGGWLFKAALVKIDVPYEQVETACEELQELIN